MERIEIVKSRIIKSAGYDEATHTLEVEFKTGGVWQYDNVDVGIAAEIFANKGGFEAFLSIDYYDGDQKHRIISPGQSTGGRQPVESSMIASLGYDPATETLEAEFKSGAVWQYYEVPELVYNILINESSIGGYMRDLIIGQFPESQVSRKGRR